MDIRDYDTQKLRDCLGEYRQRLATAKRGDKRRSNTKLDIVFNQAMATLFETELANRLTA